MQSTADRRLLDLAHHTGGTPSPDKVAHNDMQRRSINQYTTTPRERLASFGPATPHAKKNGRPQGQPFIFKTVVGGVGLEPTTKGL